MTLQYCRRTEPFIRRETPYIQTKDWNGHKKDVYDVLSENEKWDTRYRDEGKIYNNLTRLAIMLGFAGRPVPALDAEGKGAYLIGNMVDEVNPKRLNRVLYRVRPKLLDKYLKDGYLFGKDGSKISDLDDLKDVLYHLVGTQSAKDFPENDLEVFYPSSRYVDGVQGQYALIPSSSTRKEFNDDGTIALDSRYSWWEPIRYDKRLISMTDPFIVNHIRSSMEDAAKQGKEADLDEFFRINPGLDGPALMEAIGNMILADKEDIGKHIPSRGAITGQAAQNIYPAVFGLRTIAPYIEKHGSQTAAMRTKRELADEAARSGQRGIKPIDLSVERELMDPPKVSATNPSVESNNVIKVTPGENVLDKMKEGVKYDLLGGGKAKIVDHNRGETYDPETGEVYDKLELVARSASEMFARSLAARKASKEVAKDESGNIDVVKSSTSSLFERMKRRR